MPIKKIISAVKGLIKSKNKTTPAPTRKAAPKRKPAVKKASPKRASAQKRKEPTKKPVARKATPKRKPTARKKR